MSADDDRKARLKRIRALLDKTVARGCTEAEAVAAAELAARLMAEHGVDAAEIGAVEETLRVPPAPFWHGALISAACRCTNTVCVHMPGDGTLSFIGCEPGPVIAVYLREFSTRAVAHSLSSFKRSPGFFRHRLNLYRDRAEQDFLRACAGRLAARLIETFAPLRDETAHAQAVALRERLHPDTVPVGEALHRLRDEAAVRAGLAAADAVGLHRGVAGGRAAHARIGGRP